MIYIDVLSQNYVQNQTKVYDAFYKDDAIVEIIDDWWISYDI